MMTKTTRNNEAVLAVALLLASSASAFTPSVLTPTTSYGNNARDKSRISTAIASSVVDTKGMEDLTFSAPDTYNDYGITEELCAEAASKMKRVNVPVPKSVSSSRYAGISYIHWPASKDAKDVAGKKTLPILLIHGFDSSSLEYRRLGPQLSSLGVDVYAVDLLGWGFTQLDSIDSFSAQAKVDALKGFWQVVGNNEQVVVAGASLGGAAAIEFASANLFTAGVGDDEDEGFVRGTVLIDAQGFVDGIGPMSFLPAPLARLGISVLQSVPLRNSANQMSYYRPEVFATTDALNVGRIHCLREGWEDGMLNFMQSGGFRPKEKVQTLKNVPTLVLWGREDGILEGKEFAQQFIDTLPEAELKWIEECGHVPHLEQPEITAQLISEFLRSERVLPMKSSKNNNLLQGDSLVENYGWGVGGLVSVATAAALLGGLN